MGSGGWQPTRQLQFLHDLLAKINEVHNLLGRPPDEQTCTIPDWIWPHVKMDDSIAARLAAAGIAELTPEVFAQLLGIKAVVVSGTQPFIKID